MAKKQLTPGQIKKKEEKKAKMKKYFDIFVRATEIILPVILVFCVIYAVKITSDVSKGGYDYAVNEPPAESVDMQNVQNEQVKTEAPVEKTDETEKNDAVFSTPEEMVEYFNTCANKVKTDGTEVVKNFEKRIVGELKVPDILQSIAETLIKDNMKDDTDPIVYGTKEEIRENFLVPSQDYVSCLTADAVEEISYEETETEYVFHIKLKDEKDPRAGSGVGSVCDVIETHEVAEKAPAFLQEFSTNYYDCEVTATIDKETGRMVHAVYSTPLTLNVVANLLGTHSASVGFTFVKDYTITY